MFAISILGPIHVFRYMKKMTDQLFAYLGLRLYLDRVSRIWALAAHPDTAPRTSCAMFSLLGVVAMGGCYGWLLWVVATMRGAATWVARRVVAMGGCYGWLLWVVCHVLLGDLVCRMLIDPCHRMLPSDVAMGGCYGWLLWVVVMSVTAD